MAFSRSRRSIRPQKEKDPVVDLTLILLGSSGSNKNGLARQIQHHLKGCIPPDDEPTTGTEQVPLTECQTCEGKVLGVKITTVNTPDMTEDEETNLTFAGQIKELASGEFVVFLVTGIQNEEERKMEMERLVCFNQSVFGENIQRYSIVVLTCSETANNATEITNGADSVEKDSNIPQLFFDIDASKCDNDKQVQVLLNHAKTLVKMKREESPAILPASSESTSLPSHALNGHVDASATSNTLVPNTSGEGDCEGELKSETTLDNLKEEDRKCLDNCCEVFDDDTIFPSPRAEQEVIMFAEQNSNPRNISFVTANPVDCGDWQC